MTNHPPSVLWHCWLGHQTCKNRRPYNLYCVGADVKPCSVNQLGQVNCFSLLTACGSHLWDDKKALGRFLGNFGKVWVWFGLVWRGMAWHGIIWMWLKCVTLEDLDVIAACFVLLCCTFNTVQDCWVYIPYWMSGLYEHCCRVVCHYRTMK